MVNWIDCAAVRTQMVRAIKADYQALLRSRPGAREPKLSMMLFADSAQAKRFVLRKADTLAKAGFLAEVNILPKNKSAGRIHSTDWLTKRLAEKARDPTVDGILVQYPLPSSLPSDIREIEALIPPEKRVDAFFNDHSDWPHLPEDYLTSDLELRAIPSLIAYEILKSLKSDKAYSRAVLIGADPLNAPSLSSFLKAYLPATTPIETYTEPPQDARFASGRSLVITCANRPATVAVRSFAPNSTFLDFSFALVRGAPQGDLAWDFRDSKLDSEATKVPGGTGLMIGAALLRNLYVSWKRSIIT